VIYLLCSFAVFKIYDHGTHGIHGSKAYLTIFSSYCSQEIPASIMNFHTAIHLDRNLISVWSVWSVVVFFLDKESNIHIVTCFTLQYLNLNRCPVRLFVRTLRGCVGWAVFFAQAEKDGRVLAASLAIQCRPILRFLSSMNTELRYSEYEK
jgi:hypothetical protein